MGAPRRSSRKGKGRHSQIEVPVNLAGARPSKTTQPPPKSNKTLSSIVKKPTKLSTTRGRGRPRKHAATSVIEEAKRSPAPVKKAAPAPTPKKPVVAPVVKSNVQGKRGRKPAGKQIPKKSDKVAVQKKSMVHENLQLKQIMEIEAKAAAIETEIRVQLRGLQDSIKSLQKQISK